MNKKVLLVLTILFFVNGLFRIMLAQNVAINSSGAAPNTSAMLDVSSTNKGLLIPRINLTSTTDVVTIPTPSTSLMVYNTNAAMTGGSIGFFYWNGSAWTKILDGAAGSGWGLSGNAGTNSSTNFLGTTDAQSLVFRTSNIERFRITNIGNIGIGTTTPTAKLEVNGQVKITDGTQGLNKVLTSDAAGLATWKGAPFVVYSNINQTNINMAANTNMSTINVTTTGPGTIVVRLDGFSLVSAGQWLIFAASNTSAAWLPNEGHAEVSGQASWLGQTSLSFSHTMIYTVAAAGTYTYYAVGRSFSGSSTVSFYGHMTAEYFPN